MFGFFLIYFDGKNKSRESVGGNSPGIPCGEINVRLLKRR
jgi:hypothetical protein